ncbi:MAG: pyruvate formate lyase-activating protein [Bacteroidetes bacterium]|nr:MAG: pyruvate formate lyase-activating protein [Bacteroidota bacterium]
MLRVHSIETFGTHDGPGIRMVIFAQGCQFRCLYCANPDTWDVKGGTTKSIDEIVQMAIKEKPYFGKNGGVTVSGGEPTLQRSKLLQLFTKLHAHGINTALDSNGKLLNDEVKALLSETDYLLLDVKHFNDDWHHTLTAVSNQSVLKVAEYRESTGKPMWLRYVLVPGYSDQEEYLHQLGAHFKNYLTIEKIEIQPYHLLGAHKWEAMGLEYKLKDIKPPTAEALQKTAAIFKQYFKEVKIN